MKRTAILLACALIGSASIAQTQAPLPPLPAPQAVPRPAADTGQPYAPQAILPGGIVVPLFAPNSPYLKADKIHVPEVYNMSRTVHGRIGSIVSIHNPSIEVHMVEKAINTGTAIIVIAGGGHRTLNVGGESADFVPFFYNYGINTIILRNRLRADGYVAEVDAVHDAQQAIRVVRAYAKEWGIDPKRIGVMGFSAGAELAAPAAVLLRRLGQEKQRSLRPVRRHLVAAGLRRYHLPRPDALRPQPHRTAYPQGRSARVSRLWRRRRPSPRHLGSRVLPGDADGWCPQRRDPPLRQRPPPRRRDAGREPHVRWPDRPQ